MTDRTAWFEDASSTLTTDAPRATGGIAGAAKLCNATLVAARPPPPSIRK
jgi:hypothetical protein